MTAYKEKLKAPFPYFGGKAAVAAEVWRRFGRVDNYVESFFGSGAVLLGNPWWAPECRLVETVNDRDCYIANFWRALRATPEQLAEIVDNPINECDLEAWHKWLVAASRKAELERRCKDDPFYFDPLIAGRWCWGLCQWIGCGWCAGEWHGPGDERNAGPGVNVRDPEWGGKRPQLHNDQGVHRKRPSLGNKGRGVHRQLPHLGNKGCGLHAPSRAGEGPHPCSEWFAALSERLRGVRVCCGDWSRVTGESVTTQHGMTAVFLDPPYSAKADREKRLYRTDCLAVSTDAQRWAVENGGNELLRIAFCGYDGEYEFPASWECFAWRAQGGMGNQSAPGGRGRENAGRERIWFSPACERQRELFD